MTAAASDPDRPVEDSSPSPRPSGVGRRGSVLVRPAAAADAPALGEVHVGAWRAAYRGMLPDALLDGMDADVVGARWRSLLEDGLRPHTLVGQLDGRVVGFANLGPAFESVPDGELYAINVLPEAWGTGVGPALLAAAEDELALLGHRVAVLWVIPENARARRFYARSGWHSTDLRSTREVGGAQVGLVQHLKVLIP